MTPSIGQAKTTVNKIINGFKYSEKYGDHPGVPVFIILVLYAFLVDWRFGVLSFFGYGLLLCIGAYHRND